MTRTCPTLTIVIPLAPGRAHCPEVVDSLVRAGCDEELILSAVEPPGWPVPDRAQVVVGPAGRGRQLNRALARASGDWVWMLHDDSTLSEQALARVHRFIGRGEPALGFGWLRFADDGPWLCRLNALGANLRSRWPGLPYGDQGLCLPRSRFEALGGFREDLERGEDLELVVRARDAGLPIRSMGLSVTTSARRYRQSGWLRTTLEHQRRARRLIALARSRTLAE